MQRAGKERGCEALGPSAYCGTVKRLVERDADVVLVEWEAFVDPGSYTWESVSNLQSDLGIDVFTDFLDALSKLRVNEQMNRVKMLHTSKRATSKYFIDPLVNASSNCSLMLEIIGKCILPNVAKATAESNMHNHKAKQIHPGHVATSSSDFRES